jgi:membrane protease subunit (stomatin/prohibitin family)
MGLLRMAARTAVVAGTATAVSGAVARKQEEKHAGQQAAAQPAAAPAAPAASDPTAQLQQLAALHAQGVLTDEEFAAAKAKALGI